MRNTGYAEVAEERMNSSQRPLRARHLPWCSAPSAVAQSTIEYAIAITTVLAAVVVIGTYLKRGMQARIRTVVDGTATAINAPTQYEPYYPSAISVVTQDDASTFAYAPGGTITRQGVTTSVVDPGATQSVGVNVRADDEWQ